MTYQVLARKWRPRQFSEMVGQGHVLKALTNALDSGRLHHGYLFTGTRGVGKTTLARLFAKAINCEQGISATPCNACTTCKEIDAGRFVDLIEVDAASRTKVDDTRELLDNVQFAATAGRFKVYLIDEVHMFSNHSFNALLKTLEEPPAHVKFLLATTDPKKLPVTILSRCLQFNLTKLTRTELAAHLAHVLKEEGLPYEEAALKLLAEAAEGSARDSLSLLDQAIAFCGETITETGVAAMLGTIRLEQVAEILEALMNADGPALLRSARTLLAAGVAPEAAFSELLDVLTRCAVGQFTGAAVDEFEEDATVQALASRLDPEQVQLLYQIALNALRDFAIAPNPESAFEMALLRMLAFAPGGAQASGASSLPKAEPTSPQGGGKAVDKDSSKTSAGAGAAPNNAAIVDSSEASGAPSGSSSSATEGRAAAASAERSAKATASATATPPTDTPPTDTPAPKATAPTGPAVAAPDEEASDKGQAAAHHGAHEGPAKGAEQGSHQGPDERYGPPVDEPPPWLDEEDRQGAPSGPAPNANGPSKGVNQNAAPPSFPSDDGPVSLEDLKKAGAFVTPKSPKPAAAASEGAAPAKTRTLPLPPADDDSPPARWARMVARIDLDGRARALAEASALIGETESVLMLAIAEGHAMLAGPEVSVALEEALSAHLKRQVTVQFEAVADTGGNTPLERFQAEVEARQAAVEIAVHEDPAVQAMKRTFDAEVQAVRPRSDA